MIIKICMTTCVACALVYFLCGAIDSMDKAGSRSAQLTGGKAVLIGTLSLAIGLIAVIWS